MINHPMNLTRENAWEMTNLDFDVILFEIGEACGRSTLAGFQGLAPEFFEQQWRFLMELAESDDKDPLDPDVRAKASKACAAAFAGLLTVNYWTA